MKSITTVVLFLFSCVIGYSAEGEVPRQFRVWGRKAPETLSANPVAGKTGIESIPVPAGMKEVFPKTNTALPAEAENTYAASGMVPFPYSTMRKIYRITAPTAEEIGKPSRVIATPGEYVQLGFAFYSLAPLSCIEIQISPFKNKGGQEIVPLYCQDLRRLMDLPVPLVSDATKYQIEPRYLESFDEFDVLTIPAKRCERFFMTVRIPDNAPAGIVRSTVTMRARGKVAITQQLVIRILPFTLRQPDPEKNMLFTMDSGNNDSRYNGWGKERQPQLALRQMADMAEHGMTGSCYEHCNPSVTASEDGTLTLDFEKPGLCCFYSMNDYMHLVNRAGLTGPFCNYNGPYEWAQYLIPGLLKFPKYTPKYNSAIQQLVRGVEAQREKEHWQKFIYIVGDEPAGSTERMELSANCGRQILKACPNVDVTNFFNGMHGGVKDWKMMRDGTTINNTNFINEAVIKESKELGYEQIWNYNSLARHDNDYRGERIAYGVLPWRLQTRGTSQYQMREFGSSSKGPYRNIAYDHLNNGRSDYDFTYPAADGPIPTPQWEAIRQGVIDYKYFFTLKKMIDECKDAEAAAAAKAEMASIMELFPMDYATPKRSEYMERFSPETLDAWRWRVAQAIMKLQKVAK